jgi:hypothetical protein
MSSITTSPELSTQKTVAATIIAFFGAIAAQWARAQEAQRLAEKYLCLSEQALMERGTNREAVIDRIRGVMTDKV